MRLLLHELKGELRLYTRSKELAFFTFMLPIIFFVLLGSVYGDTDRINGFRGPDYLLTGMLGYGAIATGFAIIWALAWRRQESAVAAIEGRDGVRFYVEPVQADGVAIDAAVNHSVHGK